jgi:hypothetical protein
MPAWLRFVHCYDIPVSDNVYQHSHFALSRKESKQHLKTLE